MAKRGIKVKPVIYHNDRRIGVVISVTQNLGNYNSVKAQASYEEDVPDGIPVDDAYKAMWNLCFSECDRAINAYKKKRGLV